MTRREVFALLAALPMRVSFKAQTRPTPRHRVILGGFHGFLLEPGGTLRSWSRSPGSKDGEPAEDALGLGHNQPVDLHTLYAVPDLSNVVTAAGGEGTSYSVLANGRILAWGVNANGRLGITSLSEFEERAQPRPSTNTPSLVAVDFDGVDVSTVSDHVLALARDGSVYSWGKGDRGQLGIGALPVINFRTRTPGTMGYMPYPVRIPNLSAVKAISAGVAHSLALLEDGTVRAWGHNKQGQVGDGTTADRLTPIVVPGVRDVVSIAAGSYFSVAIRSDGTAMEWGAGYTNATPRPVPAPVQGARDIRSAVAGLAHVVALTRTGAIMTWGDGTHYQTGRGRNASSAPALVSGLTGVQSIAANDETSTAVLSSGRIMTWGEVRKWTRPDSGGDVLSPYPILLWLDGLDQP